MEATWQALKNRLATVFDLESAAALLEWDQQTYMPSGGYVARSEQLATLRRLAHETFAADETLRLLDDLASVETSLPPDSDDARLLTVTRRELTRARKLPSEFVAKQVESSSLAFNAWADAKTNADFQRFVPHLERQFELARQEAEYIGFDAHPYDALLDAYEPEMKTAEVTAIFSTLRPQLTAIVKAITEDGVPNNNDILRRTYDVEKQRAIGYDVARRFGYDFSRGRHDAAEHPFCTEFSANDVRVTTRIFPNDVYYFLSSLMHEVGHALYEQGVSPALGRTPLSHGASLGVHESQSRLWENMVGRSREFWEFLYPIFQKEFPESLGDVSLTQFHRAFNYVRPSFIRISSDELTYNLHILLRFELETGVLEGNIKVRELRDAWNAKMQSYLGIVPPNDALGVLQDVHWSHGLIGYFPTYTLGNLIGAQLFAKAKTVHPDLHADFSRGEFGDLLNWLRANVHVHGRKFTSKELLERAVGQELDSAPFIAYLKNKFSAIYQLQL